VKNITRLLAIFLLTVPLACLAWKPAGPIKLMIAFHPGGGADTMARLLADQISTETGWQIDVQNFTGRGGVDMALTLKRQPADGLVLGMSVAETWTYNLPALYGDDESLDDFSFVATLVPTQLGLVVGAKQSWRNLDDMVRDARAGNAIKVAVLSPRLDDLTYLIAEHYGVELDTAAYANGADVMQAILKGEVDAGWVSRLQADAVAAGNAFNIVSGESIKLKMSPRVNTLKKHGVQFYAGTRFMITAPARLPGAVRRALVDSISSVLGSRRSPVYKFVEETFGPPKLLSGDSLNEWMRGRYTASRRLLQQLGK
jgi:tripartite-type tricarboxylate transporter receptor subunit TctC